MFAGISAGGRRFLNFNGVEGAVLIDNEIDLFLVFVAVIIQRWLLARIKIALIDFSEHVAFKKGPRHRTALQCFGAGPLKEIRAQPCV